MLRFVAAVRGQLRGASSCTSDRGPAAAVAVGVQAEVQAAMTPSQCVLALAMLVFGSINTLSTKFADKECVPDYRLAAPPKTCSSDLSGNSSSLLLAGNRTVAAGGCIPGCKQFDHPFVQAIGMFAGESLCMLAFKLMSLLHSAPPQREDAQRYSPVIFALPALCDSLGTSLMYLGLTMTYASVFQMLRGSVVIFTGILSTFVLKRRLKAFQWLGMALVCAGTLVVGSSSLISPPPQAGGSTPAVLKPSNPVLGNMIIVAAQIIVAIQMVIEERFLGRYNVHALEAVGLEGIWGVGFLGIALVAMYFVPFGADLCEGHACVENSLHALREMSVSPALVAAVLGNVVSIAFFNFFGVSVTQSMSATHRMVLDSLRTLVIWLFSLYLQWQVFDKIQVRAKAPTRELMCTQ